MTANLTVGALAEDFVALWLEAHRYTVLERRWHCRWGELDIIAQSPPFHSGDLPTVVFVEVKARRRQNWDANGLLAITAQKQAKLWQTAQLFLTEHPEWADCPCRFDVALVSYRSLLARQSQPSSIKAPPAIAIESGVFVPLGDYQFCLHHYIPAAFE
ncbi:YraN family protein [Oscillatoria sp. FACHB-1407]|uniref:YraN family protein n=1 Tax=Oscillatoria sp. FACHB-1407 TaxID=2692847 RepID=UPI0016846397|nr:YraN family protein [Oscillatoria sp. FACHB-1407]MBD2465018.1 YraN family protein [Oscillatoria sp. FACHB-1407]